MKTDLMTPGSAWAGARWGNGQGGQKAHSDDQAWAHGVLPLLGQELACRRPRRLASSGPQRDLLGQFDVDGWAAVVVSAGNPMPSPATWEEGLDSATHVQVDVFTPDEALEFLKRAAPDLPVGDDPAALVRVAHRCGRLPLALSLVAGYMRSTSGWTVVDRQPE
jgi:hypothetical protein